LQNEIRQSRKKCTSYVEFNKFSATGIRHHPVKHTGCLNIPPEFAARTRALLGDAYSLFEAALQGEAVISVRMNRDKSNEEPSAERVPWCETGYYLPGRIAFTLDPLFHAGAYYVQEASSMFLEQVVKAYVHEPVRCIDLCAAPGGKSTHLCSLLPEGSLLVCNEVIRSRSNILAENIVKWGNPNVIVTRNDPAEFRPLAHFFDLAIVDAPCSGEGMFRKNPAVAAEWNLPDITLCAARQRRILSAAWIALKPGGILVYSTCTYNTEENEDNLAFLVEKLRAEPLPIPLEASWQATEALKYTYPAYRFFPHKTKGEGFFMAVVRKSGGRLEDVVEEGFRSEGRKTQKACLPFPDEVRGWLLHPDDFHIERRESVIEAFPVRHTDAYRHLARHLHVVLSGLRLGELKGNDLIPAHALALSRRLNLDSFDIVALSREEAIRYLKKESLSLPGEKGYALVSFDDLSLGFVKRLSNRANNLYPQEWRIRRGY
jgi:16S rRNA C967 or C1407 C5-methylase (RsmB/RsmF family)/NOL1/NOP2/fmu family ribosome biogenesis protein